MTFIYKTVKGDALEHKFNPKGKIILPQVNNNLGIQGSGIAYAIAKKWPHVKKKHEQWFAEGKYEDELEVFKHPMRLGEVQFLLAEPNVYVANMVAQQDIGPNRFGMPPIRMDSLKECLFVLREFVIENNIVSVASVKFGSLRSGGNWNEIEKLVQEIFADVNVKWYTYEYTE